MSRTLQFRRLGTVALTNTIGANGELIIDSTTKTLTIHDGATLGGHRLAKEGLVVDQVARTTANSATQLAQAAYNQANTIISDTQIDQVARNTANGAQSQASFATQLAQSAYDQANTSSSTGNYSFNGDNESIPLFSKQNAGGVGVFNAAEFGTEVSLDIDDIINNSEIFMGTGFAEARSLTQVQTPGVKGPSLIYSGVEDGQNGKFAGVVSMTPEFDSQYSLSVNSVSGLIELGANSADWIVGVGSVNSTGTVNGLLADTQNVHISTAGGGWTFADDGSLTLPASGVVRNSTINIVSDVYSQLQWVDSGNISLTDPNGTNGPSNWAFVDENGFNIETNLNNINPSHQWAFDNTGTLLVPGNIIPNANATYNLGSADAQWGSLFLSGNTIHIGDSTLSIDGNGYLSHNGESLDNQLLNNGHRLVVNDDGTITLPAFDDDNTISRIQAINNVQINANGALFNFKDDNSLTLPNGGQLGNYGMGWPALTNGTTGSPVSLVTKVGGTTETEPAAGSELASINLWPAGDGPYAYAGTVTITTSKVANVDGDLNTTSSGWTFDQNGGLVFPDATVQTTAYTGSNQSNQPYVALPDWLTVVSGTQHLPTINSDYGWDSNGVWFKNATVGEGGPGAEGTSYPIRTSFDINTTSTTVVTVTFKEDNYQNDFGLCFFASGTSPEWQWDSNTTRIALQYNGSQPEIHGTTGGNSNPNNFNLTTNGSQVYKLRATYNPTDPMVAEGNALITMETLDDTDTVIDSFSYEDTEFSGTYSIGFAADNDPASNRTYMKNLTIEVIDGSTVTDTLTNGNSGDQITINTGDITFDGTKIIGAGGGLSLVPDINAYNGGQYVKIYPTNEYDYPHVHITAGDGGELYIGNDTQYVKTGIDGNIEIQSQSIATNFGTFNISDISHGANTVLVMSNPGAIFEGPITGEITFGDITTTTQLNGQTLYYQAVESNACALYTDINRTTALDTTNYTDYASGGGFVHLTVGINKLNNFAFENTGTLTLPDGSSITEGPDSNWTNPISTNVWSIKTWNSGFSGTFDGTNELVWFNPMRAPGYNGSPDGLYSNWRGAIIDYHAHLPGKGTIIGTIHVAYDYHGAGWSTTHTEHVSVSSGMGASYSLWKLDSNIGNTLVFNNPTTNSASNLAIQWTAKMFFGNDFNND